MNPIKKISIKNAALPALGLWMALSGCGQEAQQSKKATEHVHTAARASESLEVEINRELAARIGLRVARPDSQVAHARIQAIGQLDAPPNQRVLLSAMIEAVVDSIGVYAGSPVRKGQVIARLRHPSIAALQEEWLRARLAEEQAEREFERQKQLKAEGAGIERRWQEADTKLRTARIETRLAAEKLRLNGVPQPHGPEYRLQNTLTLVAPVAGFVSHIPVQRGQSVQPSQAVVEIIDPSHLHVHLQVYEKDLPAVVNGQRFGFAVAGRTQRYSGEIVLSGQELNPETRTAEIHGHVEGSQMGLLPGMYVTAELEGAGQRLPVIQESAIVRHRGSDWVFGISQADYESGHLHFQLVPVQLLPNRTASGQVAFRFTGEHTASMLVVQEGAYHLSAEMRKSEGGDGHGH